jgi:hypothetical protein
LPKWYLDWDKFHSKRIVYPVLPNEALFDIQDECLEAKMDCAYTRVTPIGRTFTGLTDGLMDALLTEVRLDYFLGNALPAIVQYALVKAPAYVHSRTQYTWIGMFNVDEERKTGEYVGELAVDERLYAMLQNREGSQ